MARKSRYMGYMKELQKISKHEKTSTKESLLHVSSRETG